MTPAFVAASALVVCSGFLLVMRLPLRGATERLTAALLLGLGIVSATVLFAGVVLSRLDWWPVLLTAVAVFVASVAVARSGDPAALSRGVGRLRRDLRRCLRVLRSEPIVALLGLAIVAALAWRLVLAIRLPILDFDGLAYHVVTVDVWLQDGHIGRVPQRIWSDAYPANGELITTWLMLFSGTDALASLTGLIPLPLAAIAVAGFSRALGAQPKWAALSGLVIAAMPAVIVKANSTYIDNLGVAYVAAAWLFGLRALEAHDSRRRRALLLLTGIAAGLAAGTKATLVLPVAGVGAVAFFAAILAKRRPASANTIDGLALVLPGLVLGASWYVKNIVVFANPLWPFSVGPFVGQGSFEEVGLRPPPEMAGLGPLQQISTSWLADLGYRTYSHDVRVGGFGLAWLPLLLLALIAVVSLIRSRSFRPVLIVGLPVIVTFLVMPQPWWTRYALFLAALVAGLAAVALSRAPVTLGRIAGGGITVVALASLFLANRTGNIQLHQGGAFHPAPMAMVRLVVADEEARHRIWLWEECRGFDMLPAGARVRSDAFQLPHLIVGHDLSRQLLVPLTAGTDLRAGVSFDGIVATHLLLSDQRDQLAARGDPDAYTPLGTICRGAELFAVRQP